MVRKFTLVGHVDHGKSTVAGHLLYKVGYFTQHDLDEARKVAESNKMGRWVYAYLLDITDGERERGKTCEYTQIDFTYNDKSYKLIDTPGHRGFVRSTISAICDNPETIGIIIISVIENELLSGMSPGGMTREHLILMRAAGINNLIIAFNKMDVVDNDKFIELKKIVMNLIDTLRFARVDTVYISGITGNGLLDIISTIDNIPDIVSTKNISDIKINSDYHICKVVILYCDNIIAPGYKMIMHVANGEYECELDKIIDNKSRKPFIKSGDIATISVRLQYSTILYSKMRVILRSGENTIGFGQIN